MSHGRRRSRPQGRIFALPGTSGQGVALSTVFGTNTTVGLTPDQLLALTPRYATGGSDFGANTTTSANSVPPKTDRLYPSLDELCFGSALDSSGQRTPNAITAAELNQARFVLTAHSHSPETTLLGEPRVSIWPVSDAPTDTTRTTADDRAMASASTVGATAYYFQRHNAASATDDLNPAIVPGNATLFNNLVAAGGETLPGYGSTFAKKYPGAQWSQIIVEILDAIRGFNAVDPAAPAISSTPAASGSFVPFAEGDTTGLGRGLIVPLTASYGTTTVRGLGRYPTLFGLTFVFYVSGFQYKDQNGATQTIDYDSMAVNPMDAATAATSWQTNFALTSSTNLWGQVTHALVRAFVVPTTFQPGCGYPEVSDACKIQISGLDQLTATSTYDVTKTISGSFNFSPVATSRLLSDALTVPPADRSWGGFEGPLAWRAAALDAMNNVTPPYAFVGKNYFAVPLTTEGNGKIDDPTSLKFLAQSFTVNALPGLNVAILDAAGKTVQAFTIDLPSFTTSHLPTINGEADQADDGSKVFPSYYMNLKNRILTTQQNRGFMIRGFMIQAGDASFSMEAQTDLRLIATMPNVLSTWKWYGLSNINLSQQRHLSSGGEAGWNAPTQPALRRWHQRLLDGGAGFEAGGQRDLCQHDQQRSRHQLDYRFDGKLSCHHQPFRLARRRERAGRMRPPEHAAWVTMQPLLVSPGTATPPRGRLGHRAGPRAGRRAHQSAGRGNDA